MSQGEVFKSDEYSDGRTKQAFKDETDINKILAKAAIGGTVSHLAKYDAVYGDFSDIDDLLTAHDKLKTGQRIFDELPSEVRREFGNDIGKFYNYVNDPENVGELEDKLPGLAKQGTQLPAPVRTAESVAAADAIAAEAAVAAAQNAPPGGEEPPPAS